MMGKLKITEGTWKVVKELDSEATDYLGKEVIKMLQVRTNEFEKNPMMGDSRGCIVCDFEKAHGHRDHAYDEAEANAKAIVKAVNNTYGKGINPEAVEDMKEALKLAHEVLLLALIWDFNSATKDRLDDFEKAKDAISEALKKAGVNDE